MNDSTRQLVLLIGILTIVSSSVVVVSTQNNQVDKENFNGNNSSGLSQNSTNEGTKDSGLIAQSINGLQEMWSDMNGLFKFIS